MNLFFGSGRQKLDTWDPTLTNFPRRRVDKAPCKRLNMPIVFRLKD
jgi:hypothetical protein